MRARALLVASLAGLLLVAAASASHPHRVKLALVPLPKSALGPAAHTFSVAHDSGPVSNKSAASHTPDATAATFKKMGRLNGYALEYGNAFTGAAGITDVRTSIEQYKTAGGRQAGTCLLDEGGRRAQQARQPQLLGHQPPREAAGPGRRNEPLRLPDELQRGEHRSRLGHRRADRRRPLRPRRHRHRRDAVRRRGACAEARQEARRPVPARAQGAPAREARAAAEAEGRAAAGRAGPLGARAPEDRPRREGEREQGLRRRPGGDLRLQRLHASGGPVRCARPGDRVVPGGERGELLRGLRERSRRCRRRGPPRST